MRKSIIAVLAALTSMCSYACDNTNDGASTAITTSQAGQSSTKKTEMTNLVATYFKLGAGDYSKLLKYMSSDWKRHCNRGGVDPGYSEGYDPYYDMSAELVIMPRTVKVLSVDTTNNIVKIRASVKSLFQEGNTALATYTWKVNVVRTSSGKYLVDRVTLF